MLVYHAQPIDQTEEAAAGPGLWWTDLYTAAGATVYSPAGGVAVYSPHDALQVAAINRAALQAADALVAELPAGVPTLGVPAEVEAALQQGLPCLLVTDIEGSVQVADWEQRGAQVVRAPEEVVAWLEQTGPRGRVLRWDRTEDGGQAPRRHHQADAGWDLVACRLTEVRPGAFTDIHCGIAVELPAGMFGWVVGRSSTLRERGLLVNQGIIDGGYRGPMFAGVWNLTDRTVQVLPGERVAQLVPLPVADLEVVQGRLSEGDRGAAGFGSTGR